MRRFDLACSRRGRDVEQGGHGAALNQDQLSKVLGGDAGAGGAVGVAAAEGGAGIPIREEVGRRSKTIPSEWERDIKDERVREQDHIAGV